jgi:hypothetical protein
VGADPAGLGVVGVVDEGFHRRVRPPGVSDACRQFGAFELKGGALPFLFFRRGVSPHVVLDVEDTSVNTDPLPADAAREIRPSLHAGVGIGRR